MPPTEQRVGWEGMRGCLEALQREAPGFLRRAVVIGGAACWFYRIQLQKAGDPDFRERPGDAKDEHAWLSKDIDFTGIFRGDAVEMLPTFVVQDGQGRSYLKVNGVRLGFAQVGVTFDPLEVFAKARVAQFGEGQSRKFLVIDPVSLYREKQALAQKRNQANDRLHLALLKELLAFEFLRSCESYLGSSGSMDVAEQKRSLAFLIEIRDRAFEISGEPRIRRRLKNFAETNQPDMQFLRENFRWSE